MLRTLPFGEFFSYVSVYMITCLISNNDIEGGKGFCGHIIKAAQVHKSKSVNSHFKSRSLRVTTGCVFSPDGLPSASDYAVYFCYQITFEEMVVREN